MIWQHIKDRAHEFFTWFGLVGAAAVPVVQSYAQFDPKIAYLGVGIGLVLAVVKTP